MDHCSMRILTSFLGCLLAKPTMTGSLVKAKILKIACYSALSKNCVLITVMSKFKIQELYHLLVNKSLKSVLGWSGWWIFCV